MVESVGMSVRVEGMEQKRVWAKSKWHDRENVRDNDHDDQYD